MTHRFRLRGRPLRHVRIKDSAARLLRPVRRWQPARPSSPDARVDLTPERLDLILNSIDEGFVIVDRDLRFTYANPKALDITLELRGIGVDQLIGMSVTELYPELEGSRIRQEIEKLSGGHASVHFEEYIALFDRWYEFRLHPFSDGLAIFVQEITERKASEQRLNVLQIVTSALSRATMPEQVADVIVDDIFSALGAHIGSVVVPSEDGHFMELINGHNIRPDLRSALGRLPLDSSYPLVDCLRTGQPVWITTLDDYRARYPHVFESVQSITQTQALICLPLRVDDRTIGAVGMSFLHPLRLDDAAKTFYQAVGFQCAQGLDRAQRQQERIAQEQRSADRMRQIADAALAINAILPVDEVLRLVVDQARSIIGAHQGVVNLVENGNWAESLMETSFSDKYAEWRDYDVTPDGSGIYALVCRHNQSMRLTQDDVIAHPAWRGFGSEAGSHPPMRGWLAAPLIGRDGRNLGVIQLSDKEQGDFTPKDEAILLQLAQVASIAVENARLYAEEARARLAAEDANRVKVRFLAMISHELRTPLTSIKGFASTLLSDDVQWEPAAQQEFIRIIDLETDKLTELVSELLDLSRMQVGTFSIAPERCTLEEIIAGVQAELNALAGDHPLRLIIPPGLPPVQADARRIAQVLANLVSNAAKYSPPQTPITLRAQQLDSFVQIDIRDLGSGVPPENRERVFEPFQQVEQRAEGKSNGVGLGLAICKGVVEAHGGNIWISDGAPGAIVSFTLPLTEQVGAIKRDAP